MDATDKHWVSPQALLDDSYSLAFQVLDSGFAPTLVLGLWRGGSTVAVAVHEALRYFGVNAEHLPLRVSLYSGIDARAAQARIFGLEMLETAGFDCSRILVVDDVFDTGMTLEQTAARLRQLPATRASAIRVATAWWKPARNRSAIKPDFWVHESERWLVFPHELCGLTATEMLEHKRGGAALAARLARGPTP